MVQVVHRFINAGESAISFSSFFDDCIEDVGRCVEKFCEVAIGLDRSNKPSLTIAIEDLETVKKQDPLPIRMPWKRNNTSNVSTKLADLSTAFYVMNGN